MTTTTEEHLQELLDRLERARAGLDALALSATYAEASRLAAKADGINVAYSYVQEELRLVRNAE